MRRRGGDEKLGVEGRRGRKGKADRRIAACFCAAAFAAGSNNVLPSLFNYFVQKKRKRS